jgi:hypothetical protein
VDDDVAEHAGVAVADQDVALHRRQLVDDPGQDGQHRRVDEDHPVLPVVDDVGQLLREQPQVERVQHRSHGRHREVGLQVLLGVPQQRADAVALADAEAGQRAGQTGRPDGDLGVGRLAHAVAVEGPDGAVGEDPRPVPQEAGDGQRRVLHGAHDGGGGLRHRISSGVWRGSLAASLPHDRPAVATGRPGADRYGGDVATRSRRRARRRSRPSRP